MGVNDHDIDILNDLIATTIDSADGFGRAAEDADSGRFRTLFRDFAQERRRLAARLQERVRQLDGTPVANRSFAGELHRRWEDLKAAIAGKDDRAVVEQIERGEDRIKEKYEEALRDRSISPPTRDVIEQCFVSVLRGHDTASRLKHGMQRAEA